MTAEFTHVGATLDARPVAMQVLRGEEWINPAWNSEPDPPAWMVVPAFIALAVIALVLMARGLCP